MNEYNSKNDSSDEGCIKPVENIIEDNATTQPHYFNGINVTKPRSEQIINRP